MSELLAKIKEIGTDVHERGRNLSPVAMKAADAAFNDMAETMDHAVTPEDHIDMEKLAGVRLSARFFADMLDAMVGCSAEEIQEAMEAFA